MVRLDGKVALVTGGGGGLGLAIGRELVAAGATVMLADINLAQAQANAAEISAGTLAIALDVTSEAQWDGAIAATLAAFGKLNVLVNNAGISEPGTIEDTPTERYRRIMAVNLDSVFYGCHAAIPAMKASGETCAIVNIGSMSGLRPASFITAYCASKAAVSMMTKCIALHCANMGYPIRVNAVHPGATETPMLERYLEGSGMSREDAYAMFASNHAMKRCGKAEEVARGVVFLASDAASFTTGVDLPVEGGGLIRE
jgi:3alpha(or 20beta)-hydroxysteroid dehydrogenase